MTVGELLARVSSREITEWQAYERHVGLLGGRYEQEVMVEIHFMLQVVNRTIQLANTEKNKQAQIPEPKRIPGPNKFTEPPDEEE